MNSSPSENAEPAAAAAAVDAPTATTTDMAMEESSPEAKGEEAMDVVSTETETTAKPEPMDTTDNSVPPPKLSSLSVTPEKKKERTKRKRVSSSVDSKKSKDDHSSRHTLKKITKIEKEIKTLTKKVNELQKSLPRCSLRK